MWNRHAKPLKSCMTRSREAEHSQNQFSHDKQAQRMLNENHQTKPPSSSLPPPSTPPAEPTPQPFPFFSLPFELRSQILRLLLESTTTSTSTSTLRPSRSYPPLPLFLTSHALHNEAYPLVYSAHTFRVFPTNPHFSSHKVIPHLARLPSHYRAAIASLELRLGPGWGNPLTSWVVDERLGLEEMEAVRVVKILVEIDPSQDYYKGFRPRKDFYNGFTKGLLEGILERLPAVERVEIDGWASVKRDGPLMMGLAEVARGRGMEVVVFDQLQSLRKRLSILNPKDQVQTVS